MLGRRLNEYQVAQTDKKQLAFARTSLSLASYFIAA
tara:strand:+ start:16 stop:123 length:108 start_codon:yes stop_codon:yes gene_type:complete